MSKEEAERYYQEGLTCAQRSEWGRAATCFRKSLALDPQSPARHGLEMVNDILEYYHKDNFNP